MGRRRDTLRKDIHSNRATGRPRVTRLLPDTVTPDKPLPVMVRRLPVTRLITGTVRTTRRPRALRRPSTNVQTRA